MSGVRECPVLSGARAPGLSLLFWCASVACSSLRPRGRTGGFLAGMRCPRRGGERHAEVGNRRRRTHESTFDFHAEDGRGHGITPPPADSKANLGCGVMGELRERGAWRRHTGVSFVSIDFLSCSKDRLRSQEDNHRK